MLNRPMPTFLLKVLRLPAALLLLMAVTGCYTPAGRRPFAKQDPRVSLEGLPVAAAGAFGQLGLAMSDGYAFLSRSPPNYVLWARTLADAKATPDQLRRAIFGLTRYDYGRKAPYTEAYAEFAGNSPSVLVRVTATRALNISRDEASRPLFIKLLKDPSPLVRLEAAKALAHLPSDDAAGPLLAVAQDDQQSADVRVAALDALRHYNNAQIKQSLTNLLTADNFSLAWQARRSLVTITQQDHGFDVDAWRRAIG